MSAVQSGPLKAGLHRPMSGISNEWLPREVLARKVEGYDFVGKGLLPNLPALRPHLRNLLRAARHNPGREVADDKDSHQ